MSSVFGFSYGEVLEDFQTADEVCRRHLHRPEIMPAEIGVWSYFFTRGEHRKSRVVIERVAELAEAPQGSWFAPEAKS